MDLSFHLRAGRAASLDLVTLLSRVAVTQAATPTAQAWTRFIHPLPIDASADPRRALFDGTDNGAARDCAMHSFAAPFTDCQRS